MNKIITLFKDIGDTNDMQLLSWSIDCIISDNGDFCDRGKLSFFINSQTLNKLYLKEKLSCKQIADKYRIHSMKVWNWLVEYNIKRRNNSEAHMGELNHFYGQSHTEKTKEKISKKAKEFYNTDYGRKIQSLRGKGFHTLAERIKQSAIQQGIAISEWKGFSKEFRNINFFEWERIRNVVLERDKKICQLCGNKKKKLDVHHLIPYRVSKDNSIENLISLCSKCHHKVEVYYKNHPNSFMDVFYEKWSR